MRVLLLVALLGLALYLHWTVAFMGLVAVAALDLLALVIFRRFYRVRYCSVCRANTARHGLIWWACYSGCHGAGEVCE